MSAKCCCCICIFCSTFCDRCQELECFRLAFVDWRNIYLGQEAYLGHDFLQAIEKKTPPDAMVVVIKIKSIEGIRKKSGKLDPFIEMKLVPGDDCAGDQVQRTSMKSDEDQQVIYWEPAQRFQFVVTNKEISKIRFSLYKFNKRTAPEAMGDVHLFLNKAIIDPNDRKQQSMSFLDHENGQSYGKFTFDITYSTFHHEVNTQEQTVKEYQRWSPASGWGNVRNVHMFPTDPHAWMSEDGERWTRDDDIDKISVRMLPEGWMVQKGWTVPAIIGNPEGWQYALDFKSVSWFGQPENDLVVRRRLWTRTIVKKTNSDSNSSPEAPVVASNK